MTTRRKLALGAIVVAAAALAGAPSRAQEGDFLGSRAVGDLSDHDVIAVAGAERYGSVRLCVAQRSVHFQDIDVWFANGGHEDVVVRLLVNPGECTRWVDLPGERRNITRIAMRYDMLINAGQQAVISAYGR
jgi:hypothetical protein